MKLFCNRNCYFNFKGAKLKVHKQELWFLHSALQLYVLNICICMKFHEVILNGFTVVIENSTYKVQRGITLKTYIQEL